ncbi:hypothetical protein [Chitinophaga sp.]|uniref:hypothetical protein n=1 Tax=Chitinophaga sp. TaxID=1869181 RepID=UPI0031DE8D73
MKRYFCAIIPLLFILPACQPHKQPIVQRDSTVTDTMVAADIAQTYPTVARPAFDINKVPETNLDLGSFPFFPAPKGYQYRNVKLKDSGEEYFLADGKLMPVEGKTFKAELVREESKPAMFSMSRVERSYDRMIARAGGVKVSTDIPTKAEMERVGDEEIYDKERGFTVGFGGIELNTYVLRNRGAEVWVQLSMNNVYGAICIIQKGEFTKRMKEADVRRDLSETSRIEFNDVMVDSEGVVPEVDTLLQQ